MPIYEFQCQSCHKVDEVLMRFSDPEPTGCSACGAPVKKLISQSSFALKGSGWYVTDYGRKGAATEPPSATPPSTSPNAAPAAASTAATTSTAPSAPAAPATT